MAESYLTVTIIRHSTKGQTSNSLTKRYNYEDITKKLAYHGCLNMTHARKQNEAGNKSGRESLGGIVSSIIITNRKQINKSK